MEHEPSPHQNKRRKMHINLLVWYTVDNTIPDSFAIYTLLISISHTLDIHLFVKILAPAKSDADPSLLRVIDSEDASPSRRVSVLSVEELKPVLYIYIIYDNREGLRPKENFDLPF